MRAITLIRAVAWIGVVLAGWSMNLVWGESEAVGKGPPPQWERQVVGAALLCAVAALTLSIAGRKGNPPGKPARGVAFGAALLALGVALWLRREATTSQILERLVEGDGWNWMAAGAGVTLAAATAALFLSTAQRVNEKSRGRRRGGAR